MEKNWRIAIAAKNLRGIKCQPRSSVMTRDNAHMLATRRNCSNRFLGRKVMIVYFEVMTWFV